MFPPVEMTKGRAVLPGRVVAEQEPLDGWKLAWTNVKVDLKPCILHPRHKLSLKLSETQSIG
jgi:hypothetical protein